MCVRRARACANATSTETASAEPSERHAIAPAEAGQASRARDADFPTMRGAVLEVRKTGRNKRPPIPDVGIGDLWRGFDPLSTPSSLQLGSMNELELVCYRHRGG